MRIIDNKYLYESGDIREIHGVQYVAVAPNVYGRCDGCDLLEHAQCYVMSCHHKSNWIFKEISEDTTKCDSSIEKLKQAVESGKNSGYAGRDLLLYVAGYCSKTPEISKVLDGLVEVWPK